MSRRHLRATQRWENDFDCGSVATIVEEGGKIRLTPTKHFASQWIWWAIRSDKLGGKTPHFLTANADRYTTPAAGEIDAVWSQRLDTDIWNRFDNQSIGASDTEFYNNGPFPNGMIYISYLPIYPFSKITRKLWEWKSKDARISVPTSATNFAVGQMTRRNAMENRISPGLPLYAFTITNASGFTKKNMVLCARSHGNEQQGSWALEGAMEWLMGGSVQAEFLLDYFNIFVYPCTNPQGVFNGYMRSQPENATIDHNRSWDENVLECITKLRAAINTDTGGAVECGIDFHGLSVGSDVEGWITDPSTVKANAFQAAFTAYFAGYSDTISNLPESCKAFLETLGSTLTIGIDQGELDTQTMPQCWKDYGKYTLQSFARMLAQDNWSCGPGVGSRDFNGSTDRIDWDPVHDMTAHPLTISFWYNSDGWAGNADYIFEVHNSDNSNTAMTVYQSATNTIFFTKRGTTTLVKSVNAAASLTGAWHHILVTHDGVFTTSSSIHIWIDGVERSTASEVNGATEIPPTGKWSIGGRIFDDTRNTDGKIAQLAVYDSVLSSANIALLAAGQSPDLVSAANLLFYFKGNTSSLVASPGGTGTADGTTQLTGVGNGPEIIYP